jgi:hypothetical protein
LGAADCAEAGAIASNEGIIVREKAISAVAKLWIITNSKFKNKQVEVEEKELKGIKAQLNFCSRHI